LVTERYEFSNYITGLEELFGQSSKGSEFTPIA
jgi:hypothetical protein